MDEWSIGYLWRWTNSWERLVLAVLALMLAHIALVVTRVSYRCHSARRTQGVDTASREFHRSRRKMLAQLSLWVGSLKSIALTAPYLGLAGTCIGILNTFRGYVGTRFGLILMVVSAIDAALLSTAAGLLVAIPAVVSYNYLCLHIEALEAEVPKGAAQNRKPQFQTAQKRFLRARFGGIQFAVVAAPAVTAFITAFMMLPSFRPPRGFGVSIAHSQYEQCAEERPISLRLTDDGKLLLNAEQEDWNRLSVRLSEIYSMRVNRTLYLFAEERVPFQTVANTIDVVESTSAEGNQGKLNITINLETPQTLGAPCPKRIELGSARPD